MEISSEQEFKELLKGVLFNLEKMNSQIIGGREDAEFLSSQIEKIRLNLYSLISSGNGESEIKSVLKDIKSVLYKIHNLTEDIKASNHHIDFNIDLYKPGHKEGNGDHYLQKMHYDIEAMRKGQHEIQLKLIEGIDVRNLFEIKHSANEHYLKEINSNLEDMRNKYIRSIGGLVSSLAIWFII